MLSRNGILFYVTLTSFKRIQLFGIKKIKIIGCHVDKGDITQEAKNQE